MDEYLNLLANYLNSLDSFKERNIKVKGKFCQDKQCFILYDGKGNALRHYITDLLSLHQLTPAAINFYISNNTPPTKKRA